MQPSTTSLGRAVLDGEIVILDSDGRTQFYELLRRRGRGEPIFLLWLDGQDLRARPLIERKRLLRSTGIMVDTSCISTKRLSRAAQSSTKYFPRLKSAGIPSAS